MRVEHKKLIKKHTRTTLTAKRKMILTNCAACAAPLAHTAPRCVRCHTRYCNQTCHGAHPFTKGAVRELQQSRAALRARETRKKLAKDAFRTALAKLGPQERSELAKMVAEIDAEASARP